jgi:hypothetical protein
METMRRLKVVGSPLLADKCLTCGKLLVAADAASKPYCKRHDLENKMKEAVKKLKGVTK